MTTNNTHDEIQARLELISKATNHVERAYNFARLYRFTYCQFTGDQVLALESIVYPCSPFFKERYYTWAAECYNTLFMEEPDYCRNNCGRVI